ncbi:MAG: hypothetical protein ACRC57_12665 [Sarcina sp.]
MNKKYLSVLVIAITLILSVFMILKNQMIKSDVIFVSSKPEKSDNKSLLENGLDEFLKEIEGDIVENNTAEINNKFYNHEKDDVKVLENELIKEKSKSNEKFSSDTSNEKIYSTEKKINTTYPVFKIDKTEILKDMSLKDKTTLTAMMTKLSMQDCATIIDNIKKYGELECVIKINDLLKKRLNDTDYKIVENIFEKYINMQVLK